MSNETVPNGTDKSEPVDPPVDFYAHLAETLHAIADDIAGLAGRGLPGNLYVSLDFQTDRDDPDAEIVAAIDTIGEALIGRPGTTTAMGTGTYQHIARGRRAGGGHRAGDVSITVYGGITPPEQRALEDEIARLTAERDRLAAEAEERDERPEVES